MKITDNSGKYTNFNKKYCNFIYDSFLVSKKHNCIEIEFKFIIENLAEFTPKTQFFFENSNSNFSDEDLSLLAFNLGMIESLSYWKACCCKNFIIKSYYLSTEQLQFWRKLFYNGLGEFFYLNKIAADYEGFINFCLDSTKATTKFSFLPEKDKYILPIGGGKDSIVSLEFLKSYNYDIFPFLLNPRNAMSQTVDVSQVNKSKSLIAKRNIDSNLLTLNDKGFLNGHTPFSALLAFQTLIAAYLTNSGNIALSNESSANESTIPNTKVNHQYSKSFEFENDFRNYVFENISSNFNYFSILRPLSEIQIASVFSKLPQYFDVFKSCNVASKEDLWCSSCPKCLFTAIILLPFLTINHINNLFNKEIFNDKDLLEIFNQLVGVSYEKPFECVGTVSEIQAALAKAISSDFKENTKLPFLLETFKNSEIYNQIKKNEFYNVLNHFDDTNFLNKQLYEQLREFVSAHK